MSVALRLHEIYKSYGDNVAISGLSIDVLTGEYLTILGASGSGKSSLLRMVAGFESPDAGEIELNGRSLTGVPAYDRGVGIVFQNFALFPHLTVFQNVEFGLANRIKAPVKDHAERRARTAAMLELVGLQSFANRSVGEISGGQKQRVALGRTLICEPKIVLLDEPLGALDANLRERMMDEIKKIHGKVGGTFLHVTGNEEEALAMGSRTAVLEAGRDVEIAEPAVLLRSPASAATATLLNAFNVLPGVVEGDTFREGNLQLPAPDVRPAGERLNYCVPMDRISIDRSLSGSSNRVSMEARYLGADFKGDRTSHLFDVGWSKPLEVSLYCSASWITERSRGDLFWLSWSKEHASLLPEFQFKGTQ